MFSLSPSSILLVVGGVDEGVMEIRKGGEGVVACGLPLVVVHRQEPEYGDQVHCCHPQDVVTHEEPALSHPYYKCSSKGCRQISLTLLTGERKG